MQRCVESLTVIFLGRHVTGSSRLNKTMITGRVIKRAQSRGCCGSPLAARAALLAVAVARRAERPVDKINSAVFTESEKINPLPRTTRLIRASTSNRRRCFCQIIRVGTQPASERTRET